MVRIAKTGFWVGLTAAGASAVVGCMSVDGMRAQLRSADKDEVSTAEEQVVGIVVDGRSLLFQDWVPCMGWTLHRLHTKDRLNYAQILSNQELRIRAARELLQRPGFKFDEDQDPNEPLGDFETLAALMSEIKDQKALVDLVKGVLAKAKGKEIGTSAGKTLAQILNLINYENAESALAMAEGLQSVCVKGDYDRQSYFVGDPMLRGLLEAPLRTAIGAVKDENALQKWAKRGNVTHAASIARLAEISTNQTVLIQIAARKLGDVGSDSATKAFSRVTRIATADEVALLVNNREGDDVNTVIDRTEKDVLVQYLLTRNWDGKWHSHPNRMTEAQGKRALAKIGDAKTLIRIAKESESDWVRGLAQKTFAANAAQTDVDNLIASEIQSNEANWWWLASAFKDKKRIAQMAFARLDKALQSTVAPEKKENIVLEAWKRYGGYLDDERLASVSIASPLLRRKAFDLIGDGAMKEKALAGIKADLTGQLKACMEKRGKLADTIAEISYGMELIEWLKGKDDLTSAQRKQGYSKMKGRKVIFNGEVKNIGKTMFMGKPYVSLRVSKDSLTSEGKARLVGGAVAGLMSRGKAGLMRNAANSLMSGDATRLMRDVSIEFIVPKSLGETVLSWPKGSPRILRGTLNGDWDLEDDAKCDNAEVVSEEVYNEAIGLSATMENIRWQLKELDEKKVPPVASKPSAFGTAVKSAAGWLKRGIDDIKSSGDDLESAAEMLKGLFN